MSRLVAVAPDTRPVMHGDFAAAVRDAGGEVAESTAELAEAGALVWADPYANHLYPEVIASLPAVEWVQLPYAGIEPFLEHLDTRLVWTCAKGVYADPVAEWVMAALLMGLRDFHLFAAATSWCARRPGATCWERESPCSAGAASPARCCGCWNRGAAR